MSRAPIGNVAMTTAERSRRYRARRKERPAVKLEVAARAATAALHGCGSRSCMLAFRSTPPRRCVMRSRRHRRWRAVRLEPCGLSRGRRKRHSLEKPVIRDGIRHDGDCSGARLRSDGP